MCLIVVAWQQHPMFDLLLAANRDEFHARPAEPAHEWTEPVGLFAGRDIKAGGAWCGAHRDGRFAAVTNVRDPGAEAGARSRGGLVHDYFIGQHTAGCWARQVAEEGPMYAPFNLLVGDMKSLWFVSNRSPGGPRAILPGVVAISNGHWGEHWPKTERAEAGMCALLATDRVDTSALMTLLADTAVADDSELPDTGIGLERERFLSSLFIRCAEYGTRASTVLRRCERRAMDLVEQSFDPAGQAVHRMHHHWRIETCST